VAGLYFSPGPSVSSTNKTDCHDITEILLKVALNTITLTITLNYRSLDKTETELESIIGDHVDLLILK
jgi:hypothetical protein